MKKTKILVALTAVLLAIFMIAVAVPVFGSNVEPSLSIDGFNLSFEDNVYIKYAVKLNGTTAEALESNFEMLFWTAPQTAYTKGSESFSAKSIGDETINNTSYEIFKYTELAAKNMTDDIYARAYMKIGDTEYYSELEKYSILQYAYNMLGKTDTATDNEDLKTLLNEMLSYGAAAQKYFNYKTDRLATDSFYQIKVVGGTLSDGMSNGLYKTGATVTLTAPATNADGVPFDHWENSAGANVGTELEYTATVSTKNETYTAKYESVVQNGLKFVSNGDGTCYIGEGGVYTENSIVIPEISPDGLKVTGIGDNAFADCANITDIYIPNTVKTIGTRAFYGCTGLTEIEIPASVTSIGTQIFYKASNLKTVYYNSTYVSSNNPFLNIANIEKVVFGGTKVPRKMLYEFANIKQVEIKDTVKSIGDYAFDGCTAMKELHISSVEAWCKVSLDGYSSHPFDSSTAAERNIYINGEKITDLVIPDSVTSIGDDAFYKCTGLTSITIGNSVTSIGDDAFNGCSSLTSVTIPDSVTRIGERAFRGCSGLTNVTIGNSVKIIGDDAFYGCTGLTGVTIGNSVTSIGSNAFSNCRGLTSIVIPDSVTSIGFNAFSNCRGLTSIVIPDSVTSIGYNAFYGCSTMKELHISSVEAWCKVSLDSSYSHPFYSSTAAERNIYINGEKITDLVIPDGVTSIGNYTFYGCSGLTSITIGNSVEFIGNSAFCGCSGLTSITIPDSVTSIGTYAFEDCSAMKELYISSVEAWLKVRLYDSSSHPFCSSTAAERNIYINGEKITDLVIPDSVTSIGSSAFYGCNGLMSVTIPDSVTSIGDNAFRDCSGLTSIVIPDSVTSIGIAAFDDCSGLKTVYYGGTASDWSNNISIGSGNTALDNATRYYYSETEPTESGNYWYYDENGVPTAW